MDYIEGGSIRGLDLSAGAVQTVTTGSPSIGFLKGDRLIATPVGLAPPNGVLFIGDQA